MRRQLRSHKELAQGPARGPRLVLAFPSALESSLLALGLFRHPQIGDLGICLAGRWSGSGNRRQEGPEAVLQTGSRGKDGRRPALGGPFSFEKRRGSTS